MNIITEPKKFCKEFTVDIIKHKKEKANSRNKSFEIIEVKGTKRMNIDVERLKTLRHYQVTKIHIVEFRKRRERERKEQTIRF